MAWEAKQRALGRCVKCGKQADGFRYCEKHREQYNLRRQAKYLSWMLDMTERTRATIKWQVNNVKKGLCMLCNEPRINRTLCERHNEMRKSRYRRSVAPVSAPDPIWLEMGLTKREYEQKYGINQG